MVFELSLLTGFCLVYYAVKAARDASAGPISEEAHHLDVGQDLAVSFIVGIGLFEHPVAWALTIVTMAAIRWAWFESLYNHYMGHHIAYRGVVAPTDLLFADLTDAQYLVVKAGLLALAATGWITYYAL